MSAEVGGDGGDSGNGQVVQEGVGGQDLGWKYSNGRFSVAKRFGGGKAGSECVIGGDGSWMDSGGEWRAGKDTEEGLNEQWVDDWGEEGVGEGES